MKKIFLLLSLLNMTFFWGQITSENPLTIVYKRIIVNEGQVNEPKPYYFKLHLNTKKKISVYDKIDENKNNITENPSEERVVQYNPKGKNLDLVHKNYDTNELYCKGMVGLKFLTIKDSLTIFNWKIEAKTKKIHGYTCQLATTSFRGREYEAWFATDLPQGGPWKYDGLPGLILDIRSIDNYIHFSTESITNKEKTEDAIYENPLLQEKSLSWDEFKLKYKEKAIYLSKYKFDGDDNVGIYTPRIGIERYIEENDPDYTLRVNFK